MKRILALALVLIMVFALVGCGSNKRKIVEVTLSTEDSEAILAAAGITLPDASETAAAGTTIKWFAWYDDFHNYSEDEVVNTGFFTFKEKYGCEIEWIECVWKERYDTLANLVLAGTSPDFYPSSNSTFPYYAIKGVFQPVDDYIDYDDPLWEGMKGFVDKYFSLGGNRYIVATSNGFANVVPYNRRVIEEWGFEDPAELYANDEWTWDKFYDMCVEFSNPDEDRYAIDGWPYCEALMASSGSQIVSYDTETKQFVSNLDAPGLERASELIYNLSKNECLYPVWKNGYKVRNNVEGSGVKEGLCLFCIRGTYAFTGPVDEVSAVWGDIAAGEIMFVPLPRDPAGDGKYYMQANANGYCIVTGAENPEGVALYAACERFKVLDPTVVSIDRRQLEEIYLWTDEMLAMYDHCLEIAQNGETATVEYGQGLGEKLFDTSDGMRTIARKATEKITTWAQAKEKNADALEYYVSALNEDIAEHIETLNK